MPSDDLVKRLEERHETARVQGGDMVTYGEGDLLAKEAATKITHLYAELAEARRHNERLTAAIEESARLQEEAAVIVGRQQSARLEALARAEQAEHDLAEAKRELAKRAAPCVIDGCQYGAMANWQLRTEQAEQLVVSMTNEVSKLNNELSNARQTIYIAKRLEEARAQQPDWEKLWAEVSERVEQAEAARDRFAAVIELLVGDLEKAIPHETILRWHRDRVNRAKQEEKNR